jgi:hypothetical protein
MKRGFELVLALSMVSAMAGPVFAHATYTGYSGAPGALGTCAISCHGPSGGTITASGFPTAYSPGQMYTITIAHSSGNTIANFNGSCRAGTGSTNAGTIVSGLNTATYNKTGETNGIHFTSSQQDSGKFTWTAPGSGTGTVRLYVAGHQGTSSGDVNTSLVLVSNEASGVEQGNSTSGPEGFGLRFMGRTPGLGRVSLAYRSEGPALIRVFDFSGGLVRSFAVSGSGLLSWDGRDAQGRPVSQGVYLFRLEQGDRSATGKALLIR